MSNDNPDLLRKLGLPRLHLPLLLLPPNLHEPGTLHGLHGPVLVTRQAPRPCQHPQLPHRRPPRSLHGRYSDRESGRSHKTLQTATFPCRQSPGQL